MWEEQGKEILCHTKDQQEEVQAEGKKYEGVAEKSADITAEGHDGHGEPEADRALPVLWGYP